MSPKEFGLWNYLRAISHSSGFVQFDGRVIAAQFNGVGKSTIYEIRDSLVAGGWLVMTKAPKRRPTGVYSSAEYQALSHEEWAKLHPGQCAVNQSSGADRQDDQSGRADITSPASRTLPVQPGGHNFISNEITDSSERDARDARAPREEKKREPTAPPRFSFFPETFEPNDDNQKLASELGLDIKDQRDAFADYQISNRRRSANWHRSFNIWLRGAASRPQKKTKAPQYGDAMENLRLQRERLGMTEFVPLSEQVRRQQGDPGAEVKVPEERTPLQAAVLQALEDAKQRILVSLLSAGDWQEQGDEIVVEVAQSQAVVDMSLGPEGKRIANAAASQALERTVKLRIVPSVAQAKPQEHVVSPSVFP